MKTLTASLRLTVSRGLGWIAMMTLTVMLVCGLSLFGNQSSASAEPYTYTVTVNAGREGVLNPNGIAVPSHATISGDEQHLKITGLNYGDRISFLGNIATAADGSDYYVRGIRYGGRDGNTSLAELSFEVTEDRDYVVAFARANDLVPYTVQYVAADGTPLYQEQVYYGNVGDKPVVACLYFDGYQPRAYNITKTLDANPDENILTFVYDPIILPEPEVEGPGPEPEPETPPAPGSEDVVSADEPTGEGSTAEQPNAQPGDASDATGEEIVVPENATGQDENTVLSATAENGAAATLTTNNGGGSPAPAAPTSPNGAADENTEGATPEEETIDDNANPLSSTAQLADLDEIEDNPNPLALFGAAIPSAGSHDQGLNPWLLGIGCAAVALVLVLVAWLIYDRRSQRAFAQSSFSAPTDAPKSKDSDDAEIFF